MCVSLRYSLTANDKSLFMVHICVGLMICLRRNGSKVVSVLTSELSGVLVDTHAVQQAFPSWQEWISNSKEDWGRK